MKAKRHTTIHFLKSLSFFGPLAARKRRTTGHFKKHIFTKYEMMHYDPFLKNLILLVHFNNGKQNKRTTGKVTKRYFFSKTKLNTISDFDMQKCSCLGHRGVANTLLLSQPKPV